MDKIIFNLQLFAPTGSGTSASPYVVTSLDELNSVLSNATSSTYVNISKSIEISASTSLDLKGATVTYTGGKANGIFSVSGSGALTLTNGTIKLGSNCTSTNNGPTALTYLTGGSVTYGTGLIGDFSKNYAFELAYCGGASASTAIGINFEGATLSMRNEDAVFGTGNITVKMTGGTINSDSPYTVIVSKSADANAKLSFEMTGGTINWTNSKADNSCVKVKDGIFKMTGGKINVTGNGDGVWLEGNSSSFEMSGGGEISSQRYGVYAYGSNTITVSSNAKISASSIGIWANNQSATVNVNGGEISSTNQFGVYSSGAVTVSGGKVGGYGIYSTKSLIVSGGTVESKGSNGIVAAGGTVKVTGGTITGTTNAINLNNKAAKIEKSVTGTLNGTYDYYLTQGSSVLIDKCTYTATNGAVQINVDGNNIYYNLTSADGQLTVSTTETNGVSINIAKQGENPTSATISSGTGTTYGTAGTGLTSAADCVVTINADGTMSLSTGGSDNLSNRTSISNFGSISNGVLTLASNVSSSANGNGDGYIKSLVVINNYGSEVTVRDKDNANIFRLGASAGFGVKLTDSGAAQLVSTESGNAALSEVPTSGGTFNFYKNGLALTINGGFKITSQTANPSPISFTTDGINFGWRALKVESIPNDQKFTADTNCGATFPSGGVTFNNVNFSLNAETSIIYDDDKHGFLIGGNTGILIADTSDKTLTGHTITVDSNNKISVTNIPASGAKILNAPAQWRTNLEGTIFETASGNVNGTFYFAEDAYVINSTSTDKLRFTLKSDGDVFTCYPSKIENVEGTVKGNFANGGTAFNSSNNSVKVETDAEVTLTVGASGVTKIGGVSAGANVSAVDGTTTTEVVTDSAAGTFTVLKADYKTGTANSLTIIPATSTSKLKAGTVVLTAAETESADETGEDTVDTSFVTGSATDEKTLTATSGEITATYVNGALTEVSGLAADETFTLGDVKYKVTSAGGLMKYTTTTGEDGTKTKAITGLHVASVGGKVTAAQLADADATFWQETYVVTNQIIEVKSNTITIDGAAKSGYLVDETDPTKIYGTLTKNTDGTYTLTAASKTTGADAKGIKITGATVSVAKDFANVEITAGSNKFTVTSAADAFTVNATDSDITIKQGTIESTAFAGLKLNGVASGITGTGKVTITTANSAITSVSGISAETTFTNDLSNGVSVDGSVIKISGDESVKVIGNSAGTSVSGLSGISNGANLESVGTATTATTDFTANEESAITIGSAYTVTDSDGAVYFGLSGTKVTAVNGLSGTVTGDLTNVHTLNASSANITVAGDTSISAAISDSETVFNGVGNSSGATLAGDALKGAKINTDATGDLTIGKNTYKIAGDSTVTFAMDSNSATVVTSITNFDAAGTISGALNGVKFNTASASVAVSKDTDFAVVNDGSALYLANISDGAVVANSGEMNKVVTDTEGKYTIGTAADKFTITGDRSVEFALKDNAVTGINSIDGAAVLTASNKEISLNDTAVTLGAENNYTVSFADGKIGTVSGASLVSGVENALIVETTAAQIGTTAVNITGDKNYGISVLSGDAIGEITSLTGGATVTGLADATLKTDSEGNFTFGTTGYNIGGDSAVTFLTDSNGSLSAVNDLTGTVKTTDNAITINGDEVSISGLSDSTTLTYTADALGIAAITGLTNNATVTGAENAALNLVGTTSTSVATSLTANGKTFELLNDDDGVTITGGNVISGLKAGASLKADAGSYIINNEAVTVEAGQVVYGTEEGTADVYSESATKPVDDEVAGDSEKLAEAVGIDTSSYEKASDELQDAVNKGTASASDLNGNMSLTVTNSETEGAQNLDLTETTGIKNVTLKDGDQEITFNGENGNVAQIDSNSTGEKTINLGSGEATAIIAKGTKANATVNFGTGAGRLVSGANVLANLAMAIMATFRAVSGALMTVTNYDARNTKSGIDSSFSNISAAVRSGKLTMSNGVVNTGEGSYALNSGTTSGDIVEDVAADAGDSEGSTIFNIYNSKGKMQRIGFTHNDGGTVDLSEQKAAVILQGNSTGNKKNESTLLGGSGNDTIFAGSSDIINAGTGTNKIILNSVGETGAVLQMSENGRNNVDGFNYGFGESNDAISVDTTKAKITVDDSGNVVIKNGRAKTTLTSAAADAEENNFAEILIVDGAETLKTAVAKEGNVIAVSSDADNFANNYIGDGSGLSFSSYESEVNLNLAGTTATFGGEEVQVSGINNVTLGEADVTVFGSDAKENITAGSGNETIWAGAGKDTLNGYSGNADDKNGAITFGFMAGDGKDVINNFGYLTTENAQTADRVWTTGQFEATLSGNDVVLSFSGNKKDSLRLTGMAGNNIQLSENGNLESVTTVLQVSDTLLTYDGLATKYIATGSNASVVATSDTATANIWLEDKYSNLSNNTTYTGKIKAVDAASVEGSATLVGNSYDNVIRGAQGSSSMWGGDSTSNDTMIGGTEGNMFFYGVTGGNEGNDTISGITEDDTVNLFGIQLADIDLANTSITNSAITLKFNAGGSLTMGNNGQTFMLANDQNQRYTYDKENSEWTKA